ncbi:hypothetical protein RC44_01455 [Campylobacter jejuni]|nr:hypothetical protein RC44_01455 [Campylobacter jejuni]
MKQGDFTEVAKHYHNRPAYSPFLLEKLVVCINDKNKNLKDLNIVEVGAGTGKLTKMLGEMFGLILIYLFNLSMIWQKVLKNKLQVLLKSMIA